MSPKLSRTLFIVIGLASSQAIFAKCTDIEGRVMAPVDPSEKWAGHAVQVCSTPGYSAVSVSGKVRVLWAAPGSKYKCFELVEFRGGSKEVRFDLTKEPTELPNCK